MVRAWIVIGVVAVLTAGCSSKKVTTVPTPMGQVTVSESGDKQTTHIATNEGPVTVTHQGDTVEVTTQTNTGEKVTATAMKSFPDSELGVPIYPGAKTREGAQRAKMDLPSGTTLTAAFICHDSPGKIVDFYKGHMTVMMANATPDNGTVAGTVGAGDQVTIIATKEDAGTGINISVTKLKK
jgi:hypothetical protein